jgi:hypothetical protein
MTPLFYAGTEKVAMNPAAVSLSLGAVEKTVKQGTVSRFRLTIRNVSGIPQRVLDLLNGRRPDLQDT